MISITGQMVKLYMSSKHLKKGKLWAPGEIVKVKTKNILHSQRLIPNFMMEQN